MSVKSEFDCTKLVEQLTDALESGKLNDSKILPEAKLPTTVREHIQLFSRCMIIHEIIMKLGSKELKRKKNPITFLDL